jgi:hypothetical protein
VLPFGRLWYGEPNAVGYAKFYSRSHDGDLTETKNTGYEARLRAAA